MSIKERPINAETKELLVSNRPFKYAHLIKFERPSRPDALSGLVSTAKQRYAYLTDASINVNFDDGSKDLQGNSNGTQTYLANKVLSVGSVQEQTKATTSSTNIVIDGTALGAYIDANTDIIQVDSNTWDIRFLPPHSLDNVLDAGFREGDKVSVFAGEQTVNVNIKNFRGSDTLRVTKIDDNLLEHTDAQTEIKVVSEEIISILLNKNADDYASFINREVYIYRAYFEDGQMVGSPFIIFKGIINNVSFEDSEDSIKVTWGLNSHWGDFSQVRGRVTSDSFHRALNENNVPQPDSALKPIYAYDKGFIHAESSINMLAKYVVQVEKMDVKSKKGFLGIGASVKVKKYYVPEDRFTNLDFQIQARSIPVVYGVRKLEGIPIFADTLLDNSAEVYIAYALSEGEIGGIYDVYIDGNSLICSDKADFDARSTQTPDNTVELVCRGRADRGDVLGGEQIPGNNYSYYSPTGELISITVPDIFNYNIDWYMQEYGIGGTLPPIPDATHTSYGILDGETLRLTSPQDITLDVFTGKAGQKASPQLSKLAFDKKLKIQNTYWTGNNTYEYWGPNHRLLDTAYILAKVIIEEGETTIPDLGFVVRGKVLECYNYDYSFLHDRKATSESATNFVLGQTVSLYYNSGPNYAGGSEVLLNSNVQIIDKWVFKNPDGTDNIRFRFNQVPNLAFDSEGKPAITKFYMKDGSSNTWTMTTFNHNNLGAEYQDASKRLNVGGVIASQLTGASSTSGYLQLTYASNPLMAIENDPVNATPQFQLASFGSGVYNTISTGDVFPYAVIVGSAVSSTSLTTLYPTSGVSAGYLTEAQAAVSAGAYIVSKNTIKLPTSASAVSDYYVGDMIEVTRYNSTTGKIVVQTAEIIGYDGANKIATIDGIWDFIPVTTDTVRIYPKYADGRVSINPAIIGLDYITSKTYGRGLDPIKDLYLPSWTEAARKCDTRSDVTLLTNTSLSGLLEGSVYKYPSTGNIVWQGTVASINTQYVTFTDIIGKITNKWNTWKYWNVNEILYNASTFKFYRVDTAGVKPDEPTHTSGTVNGLTYISSLNITKVSGAGPTTIGLNLSNGNPVQNIRDGQKISGYSLYDCDDINYWRLSGWDEHSQRQVTRNQCNIVIDTSIPLLDNMNGILDHCNGILRYTAGKYYLDIEEIEYDIPNSDIRTITTDDIIGKIQLSDEGTRSAFNSLTAAFADPANKFEARNISFFNSDYLKSDKNVPKKGNLSVPGITNYYNTRLLADGFLNKSRFGLTINMTVRQHGVLLLSGTVIQVVYPRYDWNAPGKRFRIESIDYLPDGMANVVAREYDNSFYSLTSIRRAAGTGGTTTPGVVLVPEDKGPTNLVASTNKYNQIVLTWDNGPVASLQNTYTEVWRSDTNNFNDASVIALVPVVPGTNQYVDSVAPIAGGVTQINKYYWVRHKVIKQ